MTQTLLACEQEALLRMTNPNPAVLFMRPHYAYNPWEQQSALFHPTLPVIGRSPKALEQVHISSGRNVGNFIHTEAMAQQIAFNPGRSGCLWLSEALRRSGVQVVADQVNAEFDLLVFSTANFIRPETDFRQEAKFFERLKIPYLLVGAGVRVRELEIERRSLEDAFLGLTGGSGDGPR